MGSTLGDLRAAKPEVPGACSGARCCACWAISGWCKTESVLCRVSGTARIGFGETSADVDPLISPSIESCDRPSDTAPDTCDAALLDDANGRVGGACCCCCD